MNGASQLAVFANTDGLRNCSPWLPRPDLEKPIR